MADRPQVSIAELVGLAMLPGAHEERPLERRVAPELCPFPKREIWESLTRKELASSYKPGFEGGRWLRRTQTGDDIVQHALDGDLAFHPVASTGPTLSFDEEQGWCTDVGCLRTEPHAPH